MYTCQSVHLGVHFEYMNTSTTFIGIKEFRQNIAKFAKTAREKKERIVVMSRNQPLFEVTPFSDDENLDSLVADIAAARADVAAGRTLTHEEMLAQFAGK